MKMNKIYRIIWSKVTGDYCVVGEFAKSGGKGRRNISLPQIGELSDDAMEQNFSVKVLAKNIAVIFFIGFLTDAAWAGDMLNCPGNTGSVWQLQGTGTGWNLGAATNGEGACTTAGSGIILSEAPGANGGVTGSSAYLWVGQTANNATGVVTLYGPSGINLTTKNNAVVAVTGTFPVVVSQHLIAEPA